MTNQYTPDFSGVTETPERLKFDEGALHRYMLANVAGYEGPVTVQKFKGGQSNPTYLLTTPNKKYVLRRKPPGKLLPSAHAVDREYRVMTALCALGFPAPRTFALCEDPDVIGTAFFIMDFVEGRIFWDASLPGVAPEERRALFFELVDVMAQLHSIDFSAAGNIEPRATNPSSVFAVATWQSVATRHRRSSLYMHSRSRDAEQKT